MRRTRVFIVPITMLLFFAALASSSVAAGAAVTVTQQDRSINSWVWIGGCPSQSQNDLAIDFDPFQSKVGVEPVCANGEGLATASQDSTLTENQFTASGAGHFTVADTNQPTVIHSMARSRFDIQFMLAEPSQYSLTGVIAASRFGTNQPAGNVVYTTVTLMAGSTTTLYTLTVQPALNQSLSQEVFSAGELKPGSYRITAHSQGFVDQSFNNASVEADASFDITLAFTPVDVPGDVNGDGVVNVDDLLAVINAWGLCPNCELIACPADLTEDCFVNVDDLLMVINNWG